MVTDNLQPYVEGSLGRWVPVTKRASVAPFWTDGKDPHRKAVQQQEREPAGKDGLVWRRHLSETSSP